MTLQKLSAGSGYEYLTRQVAAADSTELGSMPPADYYSAGEAPGRWVGSGLVGIDGLEPEDIVTAEQMKLLFGELLSHTPNPTHADRAAARATAGQEFFVAENGRAPATARELSGAVARYARPRQTAVAGFDLTFSPVKSVSALWAVAPPEVATQVERAHQAALADALAFIEQHLLFTREGKDGARQVEPRGLIAAAFAHRDSAQVVLRDIARTHGAVRLDEVVRFDDPVEAEASLALRDGDRGALGYYLDHERIHIGDHCAVTDEVFDAWQSEQAAGRDSLMLAPTHELVRELNQRARATRLGEATVGDEVRLRDGTCASVGDVVLTRRNDRRLEVSSTDWVKNGDRWVVTDIRDGILTVRHRGSGLPGISEQLTAVEILERVLANDGAAVSATTTRQVVATPEARLHDAATRYAEVGQHAMPHVAQDRCGDASAEGPAQKAKARPGALIRLRPSRRAHYLRAGQDAPDDPRS